MERSLFPGWIFQCSNIGFIQNPAQQTFAQPWKLEHASIVNK